MLIAGNHIRSLNSHGIVGIKDKEVEASDIDRAIEAAQAVAIPSDQRYFMFFLKNMLLIIKTLLESHLDVWCKTRISRAFSNLR